MFEGTERMSQDESARVAFWVDNMERSHALLTRMAQYPVRESGEAFVSIPDAGRSAGVEMLFSQTKLAGRFDRIFYIRQGLIDDLIAIAKKMNERGWVLKIEEGYRTREMQTALGRTPAVFDLIVRSCVRECGGKMPPTELVHRRAMCLVANYPLQGTHLFGAAVDVSVFRRDDRTEVWRGKPYLEMSEYTPMRSPFVSDEERANRLEITRFMEERGFLHYPGEFWHYNKGDGLYQMMSNTGQPGRYGPVDWDPATNRVTPWTDLSSPFTPPEQMSRELEAALQRLKS